MRCTQCGNQDATRGLLCDSCVEANRSKFTQRLAEPDTSKKPRLGSASNHNQELYVKLGIGAFAALLILAYTLGLFPKGNIATAELSQALGIQDRCNGEKRCVLFYITPWCPACKASIPFIQGIL